MKRLACLGFVSLVMGLGQTASADLIVNGSFEKPAISPGTYQIFSSIEGWTTSTGPGIEIQNQIAGTAFDGDQLVELDSSANSGMYQDVQTVVGQLYQLSFAYSPRAGIAADSTGISLFWGGTNVVNLALSGVGNSDTDWKVYTYDLIATSALTRVEFQAYGVSDSYGGYLDSVSLKAVPEPSSLALIGMGGVAAAGYTWRRKKPAQTA